MAKAIWMATALAVGLGGCAREAAGPQSVDAAGSSPPALSIEVRDTAGITMARAHVSEVGDSLRLRVEAMGMRSGTYGAHIHTTGRCDRPDFTSAGPHWNPTGQQHGKNNPQGMHKGDLPNLAVGTDGRGSFEVTIPAATMARGANALMDADGAAVVIHAGADDYRTDPSGNRGARIACGVLG